MPRRLLEFGAQERRAAGPYERSPERVEPRNRYRYRERTVETRIGTMELRLRTRPRRPD